MTPHSGQGQKRGLCLIEETPVGVTRGPESVGGWKSPSGTTGERGGPKPVGEESENPRGNTIRNRFGRRDWEVVQDVRFLFIRTVDPLTPRTLASKEVGKSDDSGDWRPRRPSSFPLRPLDIGEVVDANRTFKVTTILVSTSRIRLDSVIRMVRSSDVVYIRGFSTPPRMFPIVLSPPFT